MKRLFLIPLTFAALASCTQHEEGLENGPDANGTQASFLAVNIVTSGDTSTRATFGATNNGFEDGLAAENNVQSLLFYFFKADGTTCTVDVNSNKAYIRVSDGITEGTNNESPNVEKVISAVLVIENSKSAHSELPSTILAIVNAPADFETTEYSSFKDVTTALNDVQADYYTNNHGDGTFVMSNSVYYDSEVKTLVPVQDKFKSSPDLAKADPVTIYVERVLAKVRLSVAMTDAAANAQQTVEGHKYMYKLKNSKDGKEPKMDDTELFVDFLGWAVTTEPTTSYLVKHIAADWSSYLSWAWNASDNHRSYWAQNPATLTHNHYKFEGSVDGDNSMCQYFSAQYSEEDVVNYVYTQENAAKNAAGASYSVEDKKRSQVIIYAQLVNAQGQPQDIAEWAFEKYAVNSATGDYTSVLTKIQSVVSNYYYRTVGTEGNATLLDVAHLTLKTATEIRTEHSDWVSPDKNYYMYAQLKIGDGENLEWFSTEDGAEGTKIENAEETINKYLISLSGVKVWNAGHTYYYFDIEHPGSAGYGDYGVVRNHIYECKIQSIGGLGTPVPKDDEIIIPEIPEDDVTSLAAEIKILSWRVVDNGVDLEW